MSSIARKSVVAPNCRCSLQEWCIKLSKSRLMAVCKSQVKHRRGDGAFPTTGALERELGVRPISSPDTRAERVLALLEGWCTRARSERRRRLGDGGGRRQGTGAAPAQTQCHSETPCLAESMGGEPSHMPWLVIFHCIPHPRPGRCSSFGPWVEPLCGHSHFDWPHLPSSKKDPADPFGFPPLSITSMTVCAAAGGVEDRLVAAGWEGMRGAASFHRKQTLPAPTSSSSSPTSPPLRASPLHVRALPGPGRAPFAAPALHSRACETPSSPILSWRVPDAQTSKKTSMGCMFVAHLLSSSHFSEAV
jgi:hypothetical protein